MPVYAPGPALAVTLAIVVVILGGTACDASRSVEPPSAGTIGLTLTVPDTVVESVHYELSGNGITRAGDIVVAASAATPTALVGGIPAGVGYRLSLTATASDGKTTCVGEATTDVTANATAAVSVVLLCRTTNTLGAVLGTGTFTFCPTLTSLLAAPLDMTVAQATEEAIDVAAIAVDRDGQPLTFAWSATAGRFDDPSAARTVYRCVAPGPVTVTVTVSDGSCEEVVRSTLLCLPFCASAPDGTRCDDGNACTRTDSCQAGACLGAEPIVCGALDQCHAAGSCDPASGRCSQPLAADGTSCDDRSGCTRLDSCVAGRCVGGQPLVCAPSDQCHLPGLCDPVAGTCPNLAAPDFTVCQLPGAAAVCLEGSCAVASCASGVGNCNRIGSDGCETPLDTSSNCGSCGHGCAAGTTCTGGLCLSPPPSNVAALAGGWTITVTWTAAPGAGSYEVMRGSAIAGPFQRVGTTTGTRFVDEVVRAPATYAYVIRAINAEGISGMSLPAAATTLAKEICVTNNLQHQVAAFAVGQSGSATATRRLGGVGSALRWPTDLVASLSTSELFVVRRGGQVDVFPLGAAGAAPPSRTLLASLPGGFTVGLAIDEPVAELYAVDYIPGRPGGRVLAISTTSGAPTRLIAGTNPQLGRPSSLIVDRAHGEVLVGIAGGPEALSDFPRIQTYDIAAIAGGGGDLPPKRVLGTPTASTVGGWAIAHDRSRDQLFTSCNCSNRITVFARTAIGDAPPMKTMELPPPFVAVHAMLMDEAADTVWALALTDAGTYALLELPRTANGSVAPLHPPLTIGAAAGRIAACN